MKGKITMRDELREVTPDTDLMEEMNDDFFDNEEEFGPTLDFDVSTLDTKDTEPAEIVVPEETTENTEPLDDSYATSNFDVLFDSLYNDVAGANNLITELIERNKSIHSNENMLTELKEKMEQEKEDFAKYVEEQKKALQMEKEQLNEYIKTQKNRLQNEEMKFNADVESTRTELELREQSLHALKEEFESEKQQFERYKELEEEKIKNGQSKLAQEQEHFEKERTVALESIKASQKELQTQKEQFAKYKELEEKKLDLENKNLSQSCARFKELVSQFNSGFSQLPSGE